MAHQVREQLEKEFAARQGQLLETIEAREKVVAEQARSVAEAHKGIERQVADQLAAERKKLQAEAQEQAKKGLKVEIQELRDQLDEGQRKLVESQKAELLLRKQQRELETRAKELELEVARKLDAEREKIRQQATQTAVEAERLKISEKEKVISDLQHQISILKQKAEQGSVQLQGEVLELDLENQLKTAFVYDAVVEVGKGIRGGDIQHTVRTNTGHVCGMILWDTKRTKNWSCGWTDKIKDDMRTARAEVAVLVTQALPDGVKHFGVVGGVWVCDYGSAIPLAVALRSGLVNATMVRLTETGKADKMEELYAYLCSSEFSQHVEAVVESFITMQEDLQRERRAMDKAWAAREKQIARAIQHTAQLYGSIQGIAGQEALPEIKTLQLGADEDVAKTCITR